jgi:tetratricopeptide (TPR) repeat protein
VLATVVFETLGDGPFTVEVSQVQLVSSDSKPLPGVTENLHLSVSQTPAASPPAAEVTPGPGWGWWLSLGALVILVVLAILLVKLRLRQAEPVPVEVGAAAARPGAGPADSAARSAGLLTRQAQRLLEQGNVPGAYELFSQAVELDPGNVEAWLGKGLVAQQELERTICFQRVLMLDPDNEVARRELQR